MKRYYDHYKAKDMQVFHSRTRIEVLTISKADKLALLQVTATKAAHFPILERFFSIIGIRGGRPRVIMQMM